MKKCLLYGVFCIAFNSVVLSHVDTFNLITSRYKKCIGRLEKCSNDELHQLEKEINACRDSLEKREKLSAYLKFASVMLAIGGISNSLRYGESLYNDPNVLFLLLGCVCFKKAKESDVDSAVRDEFLALRVAVEAESHLRNSEPCNK